MKGVKRKTCKECRSSPKLNKEEKCEECAAVEEEAMWSTCENVVDGTEELECDNCQRWHCAQCQGVDMAWCQKMQENEEQPWFSAGNVCST